MFSFLVSYGCCLLSAWLSGVTIVSLGNDLMPFFVGTTISKCLSSPLKLLMFFWLGKNLFMVWGEGCHNITTRSWWNSEKLGEKRELEEGKGYCCRACHYCQSKDRSWFIVDGQRMCTSSDANSASRSPDQTCWSWNSNSPIYYHIITPAYILTTACVIQQQPIKESCFFYTLKELSPAIRSCVSPQEDISNDSGFICGAPL